MARYRRPIFKRVPFVKRKSVHSRTPLVKRRPIFRREPVPLNFIAFESCTIGCKDCSGNTYCSVDTSREDDNKNFRLIRVKEEKTEEEWNEICKQIAFVESQGCFIRMVTDVSIPREVLFVLAYSPFNVVQYNLNLSSSESYLDGIKESLFLADNCGLYIALMLYPIMPEATKSYDILEFLNSMRCSCNVICFKFIEFSCENHPYMGFFNINGNLIPEKYMEQQSDKFVCSSSFKESFCTIMTRYLNPRKISCSLCNDKICY